MANQKSQLLTSAYCKFLQFAAAVESLPGVESLDPNDRALFDQIILAWAQKQPLTVNQAITLSTLGSQSTLHKRVMKLRELQFVEFVVDPDDQRVKHLAPTAKGQKYVEKLGKAFLQSLQTSS